MFTEQFSESANSTFHAFAGLGLCETISSVCLEAASITAINA
jgi:hypothetical protein